MTIKVVGEAGINHLGRIDIAMRMARAAKLAGCDIVKFQIYDASLQYRDDRPEQAQINEWCFTKDEWISLADHCDELNIEFMATPGDIPSLEFLVEKCGVKRIKIGSDDLTNKPLLKAAAGIGLPVILSTGMADIGEISDALMEFYDDSSVTFLHCVSSYPCAFEDANLRAIESLRRRFGGAVGYSDHCQGYLACVAAAAMGVQIIEKHFMLREYRDCPDKAVSIYDHQLKYMVSDIRAVERMLGSGEKVPCEAEKRNIPLLRKGPDGFRA